MLERIGYDPDAMAGWAAASDAVVGRVVRVDRGVARVLTEAGPVRASFGGPVLDSMCRDPIATPTTGDWCVLREWPDHRTTVEQVMPRRTEVVRATSGKQSDGQVLCANIDIAAVVLALHPEPAVAKAERLLALAHQSGARPLVVLTKADLVADAELVAEDIAAAAAGVEVVVCSTTTGAGIDRLRELVAGQFTLALLGSSGHGKSSLTNALVGTDVLATRAIRDDGRGRHTSVRRELVPLPSGGAVIDTPGLRGIGLIDAAAGLAGTFADVEELAGRCRFTDCSHEVEADCAVQDALDSGELERRRYDSWRKLRAEAAWRDTRKNARLRADRATRWERKRRGAGPAGP